MGAAAGHTKRNLKKVAKGHGASAQGLFWCATHAARDGLPLDRRAPWPRLDRTAGTRDEWVSAKLSDGVDIHKFLL